MEGIVIFFIVTGVIVITASFFIQDKKQTDSTNIYQDLDMKNFAQDLLKEEIKNQLSDMTDNVLENAEAKLDQMANQKIMAVGNYSEDVLKNIEDNHNEVMFLYNMLNDKETTLKNTVRDIEAVKVSVKKMSENVEDKSTQQKEENSATVSVKEKQMLESLPNDKNKAIDLKNEILHLYKKGKTDVEIAQELGLGVGEVNLMLGLFL